MPVQFNQLKPYRSMLIAQAPEEEGDPTVDAALTGVIEALQIGQNGLPLVLNHRQDASIQGTLSVGYVHFEEWRYPSWTFDHSLTDQTHHLAVVARRGKYIIFCFSDGGMRNRLISFIGKPNVTGLSLLTLLPIGILNSAFIRGNALTIWLAGTHRRTTSKADSKVISGRDLRLAFGSPQRSDICLHRRSK